MRSLFEHFGIDLRSPMLEPATLQSYHVEQEDGQSPIALDTLKKYLRVDGQHEDDLLTAILAAAVSQVEKAHNVSLTGKRIKAVFSDGQLLESYLPFCDQIHEMIQAERVGNEYHFEYTTSPTVDAEIQFQVFEACKHKYENRNGSNGKRIFI